MLNKSLRTCGAAASVLLVAEAGWAAGQKTYQVTDPTLVVNDQGIGARKGKEKWGIARTAETKASDAKTGNKVTVEYRTTANSIETKSDKKQ